MHMIELCTKLTPEGCRSFNQEVMLFKEHN